MNWKHFLRGLGAGIIFAALIMLVAYMTSGSYRMSDEEIIKRAEKLGMVMADKPIVNDKATAGDSDKEINNTTEKITEALTEAVTEVTTEKTTEETTEITTELTTESTTEATTEKEKDTEVDSEYITAEITVTKGMGSEEIAKLVQDAGIIDDYKDFDRFLNEKDYAKKLSVNSFTLNSNMTYDEIAKELTKGDK